jgi:hypothetical protein
LVIMVVGSGQYVVKAVTISVSVVYSVKVLLCTG